MAPPGPSSDSYQRRKAELSSMTQPWQAEGPRGAESSHPAEAAAGTFRARRMISGLKAAEKSSLPCLEWAPPQHGHCLLLSRSYQRTSSKILPGLRKHDYKRGGGLAEGSTPTQPESWR